MYKINQKVQRNREKISARKCGIHIFECLDIRGFFARFSITNFAAKRRLLRTFVNRITLCIFV